MEAAVCTPKAEVTISDKDDEQLCTQNTYCNDDEEEEGNGDEQDAAEEDHTEDGQGAGLVEDDHWHAPSPLLQASQ